MLNAVDDELEVRVSDLVAGEPAPVVDQPPQVGQRIEATTIYWPDASPDGVSLWLVVDTTGGVTVDGSSRLSLQVPVAEVRCGSELRPLDTLESLEGPATVSFEVTALAGEPRPDAEPEEPDWPTVNGRELHLPTCPPTTEDQLVELDAARARWEAAGIDDYEVDVLWSHSGPESRYLITVVDGETTSIVTLGDNGQPVASEQNSAVLDALPGTVEEFFDWLAAELATQDLTVIYDEADGHPHGVFGATTLIDIMLRRTGG
jgi:hypothetical protein